MSLIEVCDQIYADVRQCRIVISICQISSSEKLMRFVDWVRLNRRSRVSNDRIAFKPQTGLIEKLEKYYDIYKNKPSFRLYLRNTPSNLPDLIELSKRINPETGEVYPSYTSIEIASHFSQTSVHIKFFYMNACRACKKRIIRTSDIARIVSLNSFILTNVCLSKNKFFGLSKDSVCSRILFEHKMCFDLAMSERIVCSVTLPYIQYIVQQS